MGLTAIRRAGAGPGERTWLALHGSGRDETDMPPLVEAIDPGAGVVALRGPVAWEGGYAFFRRHPDRRIDAADLAARATVLGAAIAAEGLAGPSAQGQSAQGPSAQGPSAQGPSAQGPSAVGLIGFSNGATMAAALMLHGLVAPQVAILFRPMLAGDARPDPARDPAPDPTPAPAPAPLAVDALVLDAAFDARRAPGDAVAVSAALRSAGAIVCHRTGRCGHGPAPEELAFAARWLRERDGRVAGDGA